MPRILIARRVVLMAASLVILAITVGSLVAPRLMAEPFDYELVTPNALNELRAVYVGLWLPHAGVLAWAVWRVDLLYLGDVGALLILGQVAGRLLSVLIDGAPDVRLLAPAVAELAAGALILLLRLHGSMTMEAVLSPLEGAAAVGKGGLGETRLSHEPRGQGGLMTIHVNGPFRMQPNCEPRQTCFAGGRVG